MPVAIIMSKIGNIPAVIFENEEEDLLEYLKELIESPKLANIEDARVWLASLPAPSGWFESLRLAKAATEALKVPIDATPDEIKKARQFLSMSQTEFARALGVGGNNNTVRKIAFEWEKGTKRMNEQAVKKRRAIVLERQITKVPDLKV